MQIKYLGTGAAEGIPALFCNCPVCVNARECGGKEIRTRSQALIDGKILIDFPADSYAHMLKERIDLSGISHLLITHSHDDHFYPFDLLLRLPDYGENWGTERLHIYGNRHVISYLQEAGERFSSPDIWSYLVLHEIKAFDVLELEEYRVTALPAAHMKQEAAFIFLIEKDGQAFLYGNDTGVWTEECWRGLNGKRLDCISIDCTMGKGSSRFWGHMGYEDILAVRRRMELEGISDGRTKWILNHFSHNGGWRAKDMEADLSNTDITAAYDGMIEEV